MLGAGAVKKVYRGFDQEEGRDVAWNQVKLRSFGGDPSVLKRLFSEIKLLQTLENENIIVLYSFWRDTKNSTLNFITEACASGNLRDYRKKRRRVSLKALKNWSRQILRVKYEMRTLSRVYVCVFQLIKIFFFPPLTYAVNSVCLLCSYMFQWVTVSSIDTLVRSHAKGTWC